VQVASEAVSGISYQRDQLTLIYLVSVVDKKCAAVSVSGLSSVLVLDEYYVTIA
jgi:hypothetical protein